MTAIRKPRDPDLPASAPGVPVTPADVDAKLRRAGELRTDVELAAESLAACTPHLDNLTMKRYERAFRAALDALHAMYVDEIRRMQ